MLVSCLHFIVLNRGSVIVINHQLALLANFMSMLLLCHSSIILLSRFTHDFLRRVSSLPTGLMLCSAKVVTCADWQEKVKSFLNLHADHLPEPRYVETELSMWEVYCSRSEDRPSTPTHLYRSITRDWQAHIIQSIHYSANHGYNSGYNLFLWTICFYIVKIENIALKYNGTDSSSTITDILPKIDRLTFPNLVTTLQIMAITPVTTFSCDRSVSILWRLEKFLWNKWHRIGWMALLC